MDRVARLLTISEAAAVLNVPEGWLRKKVTARLVPFTRLGKHVRFTPDQVGQVISTGASTPTPAVRRPGNGISPQARRRVQGQLGAVGR
jgi:excisionase family DNA binding protein